MRLERQTGFADDEAVPDAADCGALAIVDGDVDAGPRGATVLDGDATHAIAKGKAIKARATCMLREGA